MRHVAAAAIVLALTACGRGDVTANPGQQTPDDLRGRTFVSVAVTEDGEPRALALGTHIEVTFEEREDEVVLRWEAGCNIHGASVDITPRRLRIGEIAGTEMGCQEQLHEQDRWLAALFSSDPQWELRENTLTLTSGGSVIELEASRE